MNKQKWLKLINALLFVCFFIQAVTGIMIYLELRGSIIKVVLESHEFFGLLLVALAAVHIFLNISWIKASYFKKS